jgi:hypothetical protein
VLSVGDPRQHTLATNQNPRNRRYRGAGLADWFAERQDAEDAANQVGLFYRPLG